MTIDTTSELKDPLSALNSGGQAKEGRVDTVWGKRGLTAKGWVALPHLLTRNLAALGMQPTEFALIMALMSHKGEKDPWLANKTLARYLGMTVRGVQKLITRCEGRWLRKIVRESEDGRDLSNQFDLTPLFDRLEELGSGLGNAQAVVRPQRKRRKANTRSADEHAPTWIPTADAGAQWQNGTEPPASLPLTLDMKDACDISLRKWVVGSFADAVADLGISMRDEAKQRIGERVAANLTPEALQAVAARFPAKRLQAALGREEGTSFATFARAVVDAYAGPWLQAQVEKRQGSSRSEVGQSALPNAQLEETWANR